MTRGFLLLTSKLSGYGRRVTLATLSLLMAWGMVASTSAHAQSASGWDKRGQAAELREDYDTAYEDYLKAHLKSPKDMRYQTRVDRMRFQAAVQHVNRGRVLRENGDIAGALNQFTRAKQIDPSNETATQEIEITERQDRSSTAQPFYTAPSAETAAMQHEVGGVAAPAELKPISNEPFTLHMVEDVKNIYTAIGEQAGLNVLFDPDYQSKRISVDLKNVGLADALHIVGVEAQTFYKTVTPDTIYIAANTFTKHADLDEQAVQTFYLTNSVGQADANDIATVLRNVLGTQPGTAIVPMISQNAIVVRETPDRLLLAEKLINDLDRPRAEVVVDVAILEVNRDKVRNLGITLPQSVGLTPQETPTSTNTTTGTTTTGTAQASNLTLNTLGNFNATNLAVTIGGGTVNALMTDADTRVLQNPSVRATDGQQATLKIGSKIPIATGSFGAAAGVGGAALGGLGVQTQFSYQDVGVTIDMTPSIHLDREVSLKLDVENLTETGQVTLSGGVTEPIIGQRSDKTTIQLHDGEPCLLAGLLAKQDNSSNSGTPGLSSIPFLKYLFGSVYKENQQDEVVFILVPHIVRESTITGLNTRAIDTGTAQDIEIRRTDASAADLAVVNASPTRPPANITAANAASAMVQQMKQQALPPSEGGNAVSAIVTAPAPQMPAPTQGVPVLVSVLPANSAHAVGSTFQTSIVLSNAHDVFSVPMQIQFDPRVLQLVNVDAGGLLAGGGQPVALVHRDDGNGMVTISASRPPGVAGVDGQGEVCTLTFKAVGAGDSSVSLVKVGAKNSQQSNLPASSSQGVVHVR